MKGLTKNELETLLLAEDVLYSHLDGSELDGIFSESFIALHKAKKNYIKLMLKEVDSINKRAIEIYCRNDITALNELYNKKVGE
jgi:hypothetical protein